MSFNLTVALISRVLSRFPFNLIEENVKKKERVK